MIKVYFECESPKYAELAAVFTSESTYDACISALMKECRNHGFDIVTESVVDSVTTKELDKLITDAP